MFAARAANGDRVAFEFIYNETVDEVYRYLVAQVRSATHAEDLAANVFLKAWVRARSYRAGSGKYRQWLFAIARNEARDAWRRAQRTEHVRLLDETDVVDESGRDNGAERTLMFAALAELNEEQRQVVILRFFAGLSHAQIADLLKKREGAVRAQLFRALRQLRKVMDDAAS